jgi:Domain of unknown function (DUF4382)
MKRSVFCWSCMLAVAIFLAGCGGDDGESGALSIRIADAKPLLDVNATEVRVTFEEVLVHKAGGGWISLPMAQRPYTIDLLQFLGENTTELVPPVELESGKYTQVRLGISEEGSIVTTDGVPIPLEVPSQYLKTDKNFEFDVGGGTAVALTVDFDLSGSIVATRDGYQLKPVLHLNETAKAATLQGSIDWTGFTGSEAIVTVTYQAEPYTKVVVDNEGTGDTDFRIYWLVPSKEYSVTVEIDDKKYSGVVAADKLKPGEVFQLNGGDPLSYADYL